MPVACHPNRWWDCCMSEDEKKKCGSVVYKMGVLVHFYT